MLVSVPDPDLILDALTHDDLRSARELFPAGHTPSKHLNIELSGQRRLHTVNSFHYLALYSVYCFLNVNVLLGKFRETASA